MAVPCAIARTDGRVDVEMCLVKIVVQTHKMTGDEEQIEKEWPYEHIPS